MELKHFTLGILPGMIAHEEAQTEVFKKMTEQISYGNRESVAHTSGDKKVYLTRALIRIVPDLLLYGIATNWVLALAFQKEYHAAAAVAAGFCLVRGFEYSVARDTSDRTRDSVREALDSRVDR